MHSLSFALSLPEDSSRRSFLAVQNDTEALTLFDYSDFQNLYNKKYKRIRYIGDLRFEDLELRVSESF